MQPVIHEGHLNGQGFRFAIVASRWNDFISSRLVEGALDALERLGADEKLVEVYQVPGAFEIPLLALKLAESGKFDAIICVGTIIRGQTPHFEYIASEVASGIGAGGFANRSAGSFWSCNRRQCGPGNRTRRSQAGEQGF